MEQQQQRQHSRPSGSKECSMCGDVGFQKELFRCSSCRQRYQHRYCSSSYPKLPADPSQWSCDWCASKHPARGKSHPPEPAAASLVAVDGFRAPGCVRATRTVQSPLDCLLQAAENLEKFSIKKEQQQQQAKDVSHRLGEENVGRDHGKDGRDGRDGRDSFSKAGKPLVHKRKRCSDLDVSKQQDHQEHHPESAKNYHSKIKSPAATAATPGNSKPPTSSSSYSHGFQFSPSKPGVGRRYRLLSEVLC